MQADTTCITHTDTCKSKMSICHKIKLPSGSDELIIVKALRTARGLVKCMSFTQQNRNNIEKNKAKINEFSMSKPTMAYLQLTLFAH